MPDVQKAARPGEPMNVTNELPRDGDEGAVDFDSYLWAVFDQTRSAIVRSRELELARYGLTLPQASVLFTLHRQGGSATLGEISEQTVRRHHSVSTLVKRMAERGLVETTIKHRDDNKMTVAMTPKGQAVFERATSSSIESSIGMIFSALSSDEKERLLAYLQRLQDKARNLLGLDYQPPFLQQ
jgi:DNA-binding MarR family transcriptional regulator